MEYQSFLYCVYTVEALNFEHGVYLITIIAFITFFVFTFSQP